MRHAPVGTKALPNAACSAKNNTLVARGQMPTVEVSGRLWRKSMPLTLKNTGAVLDSAGHKEYSILCVAASDGCVAVR